MLFILKIIYYDSTLGVLLATTLNRIVQSFHTALIEFTVSLCRKPLERFHSRDEWLYKYIGKKNFFTEKKGSIPTGLV